MQPNSVISLISKTVRYGLTSAVLLLLVSSCQQESNRSDSQTKKPLPSSVGKLTQSPPLSQLEAKIPELVFYRKRLRESLAKEPPVMDISLQDLGEGKAYEAEQLALKDTGFIHWVYDTARHIPLRNEIMSVRKAMPGDLTRDLVRVCKEHDCYRVEMYNFFYNKATIAIVSPDTRKVLRVDHPEGAHPTISPILHKIAVAVALASDDVILALGMNPAEKDIVMSNVQTALNHTLCERCQHLCVAPTFTKGDRALWTIIDLTDFKLIGLKWTNVGKEAGRVQPVTERALQDEVVMKRFCAKDNYTTLGKWDVTYRITSSDGLEITRVGFDHHPVIKSAKILDWHVSYSKKDGFGYNDAMGCPLFSTAAVVAFGGPAFGVIKGGAGYSILQDFRSPVWPKPCNYRYQNKYAFYPDGSFRIMGIQLGRGCGVPGVYRPVFRIHLSQDKAHPYHFEQWDGSGWKRWEKEGWHQQTPQTKYSPEGYLFRMINDEGKGYYIAPDRGQWDAVSRGDNAFSYLSVYHKDKDEGEQNMTSFGSCCNKDYRQGPEVYTSPAETLEGKQLVFWYVPVMQNDNTPGKEYCWATSLIKDGKAVTRVWPGQCGPRFVPIK